MKPFSVNDSTVPRQAPAVLILGDNQANLNYFRYVLDRLGLRAVCTETEKEVVELQKDNLVDCVLIDMNPEMEISRTECMKRIKKMGVLGEVPQIAVTANTTNDKMAELLRKGFDDCIGGQFRFKNFKKVLDRNIPGSSQ